jgi:hypothetical protein
MSDILASAEELRLCGDCRGRERRVVLDGRRAFEMGVQLADGCLDGDG